jgi:hypothetical protein
MTKRHSCQRDANTEGAGGRAVEFEEGFDVAIADGTTALFRFAQDGTGLAGDSW